MHNKFTAIIIFGPTASGKSALAEAISEKLDCEIVNADALQVYQDLPILTACPTWQSSSIKHHLYQIISGYEHFSVAKWLEQLQIVFNNTKKTLVIVGGTGLYQKLLLDGISIIPEISPTTKKEAEMKLAEVGNECFFSILQQLDPDLPKHIIAADSQRMLRAYCVKKTTKQSISALNSIKQPSILTGKNILKIAINPPIEQLYRQCNERFSAMLNTGVLEEVLAFLENINASSYAEKLTNKSKAEIITSTHLYCSQISYKNNNHQKKNTGHGEMAETENQQKESYNFQPQYHRKNNEQYNDKSIIRNKCDKSIDCFFEEGSKSTIYKAAGLRPIIRHLYGAIDREEMTKMATQETRNYAKRQYTWLRNNFKDFHQISEPDYNLISALLEK